MKETLLQKTLYVSTHLMEKTKFKESEITAKSLGFTLPIDLRKLSLPSFYIFQHMHVQLRFFCLFFVLFMVKGNLNSSLKNFRCRVNCLSCEKSFKRYRYIGRTKKYCKNIKLQNINVNQFTVDLSNFSQAQNSHRKYLNQALFMTFTFPFFFFPCCNRCHASFFFLEEKN